MTQKISANHIETTLFMIFVHDQTADVHITFFDPIVCLCDGREIDLLDVDLSCNHDLNDMLNEINLPEEDRQFDRYKFLGKTTSSDTKDIVKLDSSKDYYVIECEYGPRIYIPCDCWGEFQQCVRDASHYELRDWTEQELYDTGYRHMVEDCDLTPEELVDRRNMYNRDAIRGFIDVYTCASSIEKMYI